MRILASHFHEKSDIIRRKYNNLYHLNEKIEFMYQDFYVTEWSLYRKYTDLDSYFSNNNGAILSSKNMNTFDDLIEFIKKLESKRINRYRSLK